MGALEARRRAGLFVVIGAVMVIVGVFLPWVSASGPGGTVSENGIGVGTWGMLILGGLALMRGLAMLRPVRLRANLGTPLIGGVLLAVLMALRWSDLQGFIRAAQAQGPTVSASLGIGVWVTIAGIVSILVGSVTGLARRRRR